MDYRRFFGPGSPLAEAVPNFAPREQQQAMAEAVGEALGELHTLVVEAGTGIGKTFAYLVPALTSGQRVIISTGTRNLQDQLYQRDLPTVAQAIGRPVKVALLKGRANYLCKHRLQLAHEQGATDRWLAEITHWAAATDSGEKSELPDVPGDAPVWPRVTSTVDNCLGGECPAYDGCHVVNARREAQAADIVVVNHHLLLADFALKEEGFGELLPGADACIVDEAHQLPEVAAQFFGVAVSSRQIGNLVRDTVAELLDAGHSEAERRAPGEALERALADCTLQLARQPGRQVWPDGASPAQDAVAELHEALAGFAAALEPLAGASAGLDHCRARAEDFGARLAQFDASADSGADSGADGLRWVDSYRRGFSLHMTPFDVSERLGELMSRVTSAWVLTSATLAVGQDFSHFLGRIGLADADTLKLDSPFDFEHNALLYMPNNMPDPGSPEYTAAVCSAARPVIEAAGGGAFVLFTSHRALQEAARLFAAGGDEALACPLLVQGTGPRAALLEQFRRHGDSVLLGTASFWEGVDVRGTALRLVVIDKLPFASPGDPLMQARLEALRRAGLNPFGAYQLPQAVLTLKQGVGRLIRDHDDRGVAMLCDPRLKSRSYGRVFLSSLPPMPVTDAESQACDFFADRAPFGQSQLL